MRTSPLGKTTLTGSILKNELFLRAQVEVVYFLHKGLCTVFRKHSGNHIHDNIELCLICSCNIDENISSVQSDFAVIRVDDRRH